VTFIGGGLRSPSVSSYLRPWLQLRLDCDSTAIRSCYYDHSTTYLLWGWNYLHPHWGWFTII